MAISIDITSPTHLQEVMQEGTSPIYYRHVDVQVDGVGYLPTVILTANWNGIPLPVSQHTESTSAPWTKQFYFYLIGTPSHSKFMVTLNAKFVSSSGARYSCEVDAWIDATK